MRMKILGLSNLVHFYTILDRLLYDLEHSRMIQSEAQTFILIVPFLTIFLTKKEPL